LIAAQAHNQEMELLERSQQLKTLSSLLDEAAEGTGRLVLVAGEAGVGKTALCRKFCDSVAERSTAMWGACDPLAAARPLGPLVDISTELGGEIPGLLREGVRDRIFEVTLHQLTERSKATIVVFEDVHWADDSTLDLLRFLARRIESAHVLLLVTYRDDQLDQTHPLRVVLGDLASAAAVRRLAIRRYHRRRFASWRPKAAWTLASSTAKLGEIPFTSRRS